METEELFGQNKNYMRNSCLLATLNEIWTVYAGLLETKLGADRVDDYGVDLVNLLDAARTVAKGPIYELFGLSREEVSAMNLRDRLTSNNDLLDLYSMGDYPEFYDLPDYHQISGFGGCNVNTVLMQPVRFRPT